MASEVLVGCVVCGQVATVKVGESGNKETALTLENIEKAFGYLEKQGWVFSEDAPVCPTHREVDD